MWGGQCFSAHRLGSINRAHPGCRTSNVGRMPAGDPPFGGQDTPTIVPTGHFERPTRTLIGFELAEPFQVPPYAAKYSSQY